MSIFDPDRGFDEIDGTLGLLLACALMAYLFRAFIYVGPDRNLDGQFTYRDILYYVGDVLSWPAALIREVEGWSGVFHFFEIPPYIGPSIATSALGAPLLIFAMLVWSMLACELVSFVRRTISERLPKGR